MLRRVIAGAVAAPLLVCAVGRPAMAADTVGRLARDLKAAHKVATGEGVTVAILADGMDPRIGELAGRVKVGPDLVKRTEPDSREGTAIASMIAGKGGVPGTSIKGIAPAATILSVRVRPAGAAYKKFAETDLLTTLAKGIRYAADHGAEVIYLGDAQGRRSNAGAVAQAIDYAVRKKVVLVTTAGGLTLDGKPAPQWLSYPAAIPGVIAVGATDAHGKWQRANSAHNSTMFVSAPGTPVNVTGDGGQGGGTLWGDDAAEAWVAGTAALIKEKYPDMSPALVAQALAFSTRQRPAGGYDTRLGFGVINPAGALKEAARLGAPADVAAPGKNVVDPDARFGGGLPDSPINAAARDDAKVTNYGLIAGAGLLLFVISSAGGAMVIVRRRRRRAQAAARVVPAPARAPAPVPAPAPAPERPYGRPPLLREPVDRQVWPPLPADPADAGQETSAGQEETSGVPG